MPAHKPGVTRVKMMTTPNYFARRPSQESTLASAEGEKCWGGWKAAKSRTSRWLIYAEGRVQIVHLAFCPITGNIEPQGSGPISKESACNERSEAGFYQWQ